VIVVAIAVKALLRIATIDEVFVEFALVSPHNVTPVIAAAPARTTKKPTHARVC
jgi:hypothetical protein